VPIVETGRAKEFVALLRNRVSDRTARHCIFAAEYMASFAARAGVAHDDAVTAGLLHDLCKGMSDAELLAAADAYGLAVNDAQRRKPQLLHGHVAAEECRRELGIGSEDVYEAIAWHSTGRPGLARLGLALYVADFAEPSRTFREAEEARRILRGSGFEAALRYVAQQKFDHIMTKPVRDPVTAAFHAWVEAEFGL
jgi:predicted HD superfamily hydrolase involved in NAD metabolism